MVSDMFPASAGMNRYNDAVRRNGTDVPRKRGDEPMDITDTEMDSACSPQARG